MLKKPISRSSAANKKDRRRFFRKPMQMPLAYQSLKKNTISTIESNRTFDISAGGLAMLGSRPLEQDQLLLVTLYLPPVRSRVAVKKSVRPKQNASETATILSRVAWCKPTTKGEFYKLGIQFLDLATDDRKRLKSFLIDWKLDHKASKLYT
jgi:c-di-GMP-binding flagellar brake protein YcgR